MIQNHLRHSKCFVCYPKTIQHRIILKLLLKKMSIHEQIADVKNQEALKDSINQGFHQLIKLVMMYDIKNQSHKNTTLFCKHLKLQNAFKKILKCDSNLLNKVCTRIARRISQKQYHLWLLSTSIKNIVNTIEKKQLQGQKNTENHQQIGQLSAIQKKSEKKGPLERKTEIVSLGNSVNFIYFPKTQTSISQGINQLRLNTSGLLYESNSINNP